MAYCLAVVVFSFDECNNRAMIVNTTDLEIIRARESLASMGGLDAKRPTAWVQYGYTEEPTFSQYLQAYERGGAAHGAIHRLLDKCWQQLPRIKTPGSDTPSALEKQVQAVFKAAKAWPALRDLDRRNMVGRYAGLIYRVADNLQLREPMGRATQLVELVPVYEDQLRVTVWHADPAQPEYGKPAMWQYRSRMINAGDTQGQPIEWVDIHPSRVQIMAEGAVGDFMAGVPMLKAGFNALVDLEKISGGSAESYLKNSARAITFEYDKDIPPTAFAADGTQLDPKTAIEDSVRRLNSSIDSTVITSGAKVGVLQTHTSDPTGAFQLAANLFSSSFQIPFTVLFGQQTGRLASDQDQKDFAARAMSRQQNELTPLITECVQILQMVGIIIPGEFEIEWPDLMAPGDKEKLENLKAMTTAMREAFGAGVPSLFTVEQLLQAAGYTATPGQ